MAVVVRTAVRVSCDCRRFVDAVMDDAVVLSMVALLDTLGGMLVLVVDGIIIAAVFELVLVLVLAVIVLDLVDEACWAVE